MQSKRLRQLVFPLGRETREQHAPPLPCVRHVVREVEFGAALARAIRGHVRVVVGVDSGPQSSGGTARILVREQVAHLGQLEDALALDTDGHERLVGESFDGGRLRGVGAVHKERLVDPVGLWRHADVFGEPVEFVHVDASRLEGRRQQIDFVTSSASRCHDAMHPIPIRGLGCAHDGSDVRVPQHPVGVVPDPALHLESFERAHAQPGLRQAQAVHHLVERVRRVRNKICRQGRGKMLGPSSWRHLVPSTLHYVPRVLVGSLVLYQWAHLGAEKQGAALARGSQAAGEAEALLREQQANDHLEDPAQVALHARLVHQTQVPQGKPPEGTGAKPRGQLHERPVYALQGAVVRARRAHHIAWRRLVGVQRHGQDPVGGTDRVAKEGRKALARGAPAGGA
eukprot:4828814-Pyramimonas_sp.AAC.1